LLQEIFCKMIEHALLGSSRCRRGCAIGRAAAIVALPLSLINHLTLPEPCAHFGEEKAWIGASCSARAHIAGKKMAGQAEPAGRTAWRKLSPPDCIRLKSTNSHGTHACLQG
jgi:hypothetical protein